MFQRYAGLLLSKQFHDGVIKWKRFPHYWPFVWEMHLSPVNSPHRGQWRGALMFSLIYALNKGLSKQPWGWWFNMPSCSLWSHCNVTKHHWNRNMVIWTTFSSLTAPDIVILTTFSATNDKMSSPRYFHFSDPPSIPRPVLLCCWHANTSSACSHQTFTNENMLDNWWDAEHRTALSTVKPQQNGQHIADDISEYTFRTTICILLQISLKFLQWVNSMWPSDTRWRQRSGSTLAQVMACCLTAPSHYLNQCRLIISEVQWHSH